MPIDKEFFFKHLTSLCAIATPYGKESLIHPLIIPFLEEQGFTVKTGREVQPDNKEALDAIYAHRVVDGKPANIMFNAHLDVVNSTSSAPFRLSYKPSEFIFGLDDNNNARFVRNTNYERNVNAYNRKLRKIKHMIESGISHEIIREGDILKAYNSVIGGDDRCGIVACMALATSYPYSCKILLSTGEEQGKGAHSTWKEFNNGVDFAFTIDRPGEADFVKSIYGTVLQSEEFRKYMVDMGQKYKDNKVVVVEGRGADAAPLSKMIPECFNVSAGYHGNHGKDEFINVQQLYTTYLWMLEAALDIYNTNRKPFPRKEETKIVYQHKESFLVGSTTGYPPLDVKNDNHVSFYTDKVNLTDVTGKIIKNNRCYKYLNTAYYSKPSVGVSCKKIVVIKSTEDNEFYTIDEEVFDAQIKNMKPICKSEYITDSAIREKLDGFIGKTLKLRDTFSKNIYDQISQEMFKIHDRKPWKVVSYFSSWSDSIFYLLNCDDKYIVVNSFYTTVSVELPKKHSYGYNSGGNDYGYGYD